MKSLRTTVKTPLHVRKMLASTASRRSLPILAILGAAAGFGACGESGASSGAGTRATTPNPTHASAQSSAAQGEAQTQKLADEAQQILQQLASTAGEMSRKTPPERAYANQLLGRLQVQAANLAQRARDQLSTSNPAREAIVTAGRQGAKTAAELRRIASSPEAGNALKSLQGDLGAVANKVGAVSQQLANGEAKKIAGDLEAVATHLSGAH